MTTVKEIEKWFVRGVHAGADYMIVVCDTYDWSDYPSYVAKPENLTDAVDHFNGRNMQKVMEVYDLHADREKQLNMNRCRADLESPQ